MTIWCCGCSREVAARLTDGREIYPHRPDLRDLPFWKCDACGNYVGCHHKTSKRTRPLGNIPTSAIRRARQRIHRALDPLWQHKTIGRGELYSTLSKVLGREYHTSELRSLSEATKIQVALLEISQVATGEAKRLR